MLSYAYIAKRPFSDCALLVDGVWLLSYFALLNYCMHVITFHRLDWRYWRDWRHGYVTVVLARGPSLNVYALFVTRVAFVFQLNK